MESATHRLDAEPGTAVDVLSAERQPVLTVDPGDTVVVHTLDSGGYLERLPIDGPPGPRLLGPSQGQSRGHCLVGPIEVRGAGPGQVLAVRFDALVPDAWGATYADVRDTPLNRRLGLDGSTPVRLVWDLDVERGVGTAQNGVSVRLAPFLGLVGLPPEPAGEHSTVPPRAEGAGNVDCRELVAGSTLFIPVTVPGAMLCVGDGHAAQGDGEVSGTAIECGMTSTITLDLVDDPPVPGVHATTPAGRITFGFDADLNEATAVALDAMLDWVVRRHDVRRAEALALASVAVSLRVTQVANQTWGVHALLPSGALFAEGTSPVR